MTIDYDNAPSIYPIGLSQLAYLNGLCPIVGTPFLLPGYSNKAACTQAATTLSPVMNDDWNSPDA